MLRRRLILSLAAGSRRARGCMAVLYASKAAVTSGASGCLGVSGSGFSASDGMVLSGVPVLMSMSVSMYAFTCLQVLTDPLHSASSRLRSRCFRTYSAFFSRRCCSDPSSSYFLALRTIQPPGARSMRRPSCSGSDESGSGPVRILTAFSAPSTDTRASRASPSTVATRAKPSWSLSASRVIQTTRVSMSVSQTELVSRDANSLLYNVPSFPVQNKAARPAR